MAGYKKILLVVDLSDDSAHIGARARDMAQRDNAALEILHVVEFVPVEPMGETLMPTVQIEAELVNRARQRITQLAEELGAHEATLHIEAGSVKTEIVRVAREIGADLIVIGCRERHGISILVNLTEDTVLHAACCDVLAVRVGKKS